MHLYLIRHGESEMNVPEWDDAGVYDIGLTERGHAQAKACAAWAKENLLKPDIIFSSTLKRTRETAAYLEEAFGMAAQFDDRIREIGNNFADHSPVKDEDRLTYADYWASEKPFDPITAEKTGESMMHFRARVGHFFDQLIRTYKDEVIIVVGHGFVIDMFYDTVYNIGPYRSVEVWTSNTGICHLQYMPREGREHWRLHFSNRIEHLNQVGGLGLTINGTLESAHGPSYATAAEES